MRLGPIGPGPLRWVGLESRVPIALRSAPAQKVPLFAPQHRHRRRLVAVELLESLDQRHSGGSVDGVAGMRTIEDHRRHRAVALRPYTTGHVASTSRRLIAPLRQFARRSSRRLRAALRRASRPAAVHPAAPDRSAGGAPSPRPPTNRAGMPSAAVHVAQQPMTGVRPPGQIPQLPGQLRRVVVAGSAAPAPGRQTLGGQFVGRGCPAATTPLREAHRNALCCRVFRNAARVRASLPTAVTTSGDPSAVPLAGLRVERVVLAALPRQQPIGKPVAVVGSHQVTGTDHPGQRHPQAPVSLMPKSAVSRM